MKITKREIFIIIILICIALVRFSFSRPLPPAYDSAIGREVSVQGVVVNPPDIRLNNIRLTIRPKNQEANILAVVPRTSDVSYGDMVKAHGVLSTPENFETSSGKEFNYIRYLANQDIYFIIQDADIEVVSHGNGNSIKSLLFKFRESFMKNIDRVIAPPESDLADGLILGARGGFDSKTRDEFISTGTIHIIALSGYNVTIVAEGVMKLLGVIFAQVLSILAGIVVVILFVIMAGASATAIRAGIMAVILLFARLTGRKYDAIRALVIAGLLMIAYDPRLLSDISFQLSFIATSGVLLVTPKVIKWVWFLPMGFKLRELVATTIAATVSVLPLLLYSTGVFSLVSLPANILILPLIPLTMFMSFLAGVLGFINPIISLPFAYISDLLLSYILSVIHFFASLPFASINIKSFPLVLTLALYALIIWWVSKKRS
ncbi:MAG: ComEC/Rec2 family competence protein [Patescibacteria group bacterium]